VNTTDLAAHVAADICKDDYGYWVWQPRPGCGPLSARELRQLAVAIESMNAEQEALVRSVMVSKLLGMSHA
jgi:hypothetical protein